MKTSLNNIQILKVHVANLSLSELLGSLRELARQPVVSIVNYANAHGCNLSVKNRDFQQAMSEADIVFCDGIGVKIGARILGTPLKDRMTPPDWIDRFFQQCVDDGASVYFIGEREEDCRRFYETVLRNHPDLKVAGRHHGYFQFDSEEEVLLVSELNRLRPHCILTGMGMPKQELWAQRMRDRLSSGVILSTGALFLWYAGKETRRRNFLTDNGFEWLLRYLRHPLAHFRRYILGNPLFIFRILRQKVGITV